MSSSPTRRTDAVLERVEANLRLVRSAEFERLVLARDWALAHVLTDPHVIGDPRRQPHPLGAVGLLVDEYAGAELAAALELHPLAGRRLMADAVDLHDRHPQLWRALSEGRVDAWVARRIAATTSDLSQENAQWVDAQLAEVLGSLPTGRLLRLAEARVVEADQALADRKAEAAAAARSVWTSRHDEHGTRTLVVRGDSAGVRRLHATIDHVAHLLLEHGDAEQRALSMDELRAEAAVLMANPLAVLKLLVGAGEAVAPEAVADAIRSAAASKVRPWATVYVHVAPAALQGRGVARAEEVGALTRERLIELLGHHQVRVQPVIDLNEGMAADCYEVPAAIDERLQLSKPADVFPFASSMSRRLDRDHTVPYDDDGPPGQTAEPNLGKLARHHHRIKTHAGWRVEQRDNRFTWTTPHGRVFVTDRTGTHAVRPAAKAIRLVPYWPKVA